MKKVLIFGMTENYAGMENFIINYYRNINKEKIHFDFLVTTKKTIAFEEEIISNKSKIYRIGKKRENYFEYKRNIKEFFINHSKEYDAIWCNMCNLKNIDYLVYAKKYGIKCRILHSHASGISNTESIPIRYIYRLRQLYNKKRQIKYVTDYWACSKEAAKYLFNKKIFNNNEYSIINNGIKFDTFKYDVKIRIQKRKELNIDEQAYVIGHVGRFSPEKNHKYLIDVFKKIHEKRPNSLLMLIGEGENLKSTKEYVDQNCLKENVLFLGQRSDINQLYSAMDTFIFPSIYEGLGIALLEAQASQLPCYASFGVPLTSKITNLISYFDLSISSEQLATKILEDNFKRFQVQLLQPGKQYDILECAKDLERKLEII